MQFRDQSVSVGRRRAGGRLQSRPRRLPVCGRFREGLSWPSLRFRGQAIERKSAAGRLECDELKAQFLTTLLSRLVLCRIR